VANPNKKAPKWWLIFGILFFLIGVGGCGLGSAKAASFANDFETIGDTVPYGSSLEVSGRSGALSVVFTSTLTASCTVVDENGNTQVLEAVQSGIDDTTSDGFFAQGGFEEDGGITYVVECGGGLDDSGEFGVVSINLSDLLIVAGGIAGGGFMLFLGFIFIVVGIIRRVSWGSKRKKMAAGGYTPPGAGAGGYVPPAPGGYVAPAPGGYGTPPAPGQAATPPPAPGGYATPPAPGQVAQPPADPWGGQPQG